MLMKEPTLEMIEQWETVWQKYKDKLLPNRKSGVNILEYLTNKYPLREVQGKYTQVVIDNVVLNKHSAKRIPKEMKPSAVAFIIENTGEGRKLYENQDEIFKGCEIFVGIELVSGNYHVEGSSLLWDELCAFQGLDEMDIENSFCVAQYIYAIEKFGQCDS